MKRILTLLVFACLPFWAGAYFIELDSAKSIFEILQREDYVELTLETDFKTLIRHKRAKKYQPAKLSYFDNDGLPQTWDIEVRTRGNMRLQVCSLPPLKLRFSKKELAAKGMRKHHTLKMVISCRGAKGFEQYVLREYLAYQLYNILTEQSFRVQLAKVKFTDTGGDKAPSDGFAFLIEDDDEMAERCNGKIISGNVFSSRVLNTGECERFSLFQYMIGNTDWYIYSAHNIKLFGENGTSTPIPIPYDFDYAGLVNTPYAAVNDRVPIAHVSERYYQGFCRRKEDTRRTIQLFLDKKEELIGYCEQFPHFDDRSRKYVLKYLRSFYKIIEHPKRLKREILQKCNQWLRPID
ncbi:MAG: hypothetical protein ACE5FF_05185 [Saprospiraceae bacterium]